MGCRGAHSSTPSETNSGFILASTSSMTQRYIPATSCFMLRVLAGGPQVREERAEGDRCAVGKQFGIDVLSVCIVGRSERVTGQDEPSSHPQTRAVHCCP
jgi:hypothetical protein